MTNEEAKKIIDNKLAKVTTVGSENEALEIASKAMEKQIPKKPKEYEDKYYACPSCRNVLMMKWEKYPTVKMPRSFGLKYCLGCGQEIDWSDEEVSE